MRVIHGDALALPLDNASIDAVVTDPPYGLAFMGKVWDTVGPDFHKAWAAEALRVLKPGGHLLAFGGARTYHRMACAVEDVGFEVRDSIIWLYSSGFPKSPTALKPASEPIVVARKPFVGSVRANVLVHGTGTVNIDGCRVQTGATHGRWPANVVLSHAVACGDTCVGGCSVAELDRQSGTLVSGSGNTRRQQHRTDAMAGTLAVLGREEVSYGDSGGASRFFPAFRYQAKAPTKERPRVDGVAHPTVKPLALMQWLCRLVTPPGGVILDPFAGSGTTGEAALLEGFEAVLIERDESYLPLIAARLGKHGVFTHG